MTKSIIPLASPVLDEDAAHANAVWLTLLWRLLGFGRPAAPRKRDTHELLACKTTIDMTRPVVTAPGRRLGYRFMPAEAAWILSGDNRVATIAPFSKQIATFSDDGERFFGAYGPRIVDQIGYVLKTLRRDPSSRQAVMTIWREQPGDTRDVPCTVAIQWLIRDAALNAVATMRSSDAWLGWPYDVFNFSMLSAYLARHLQLTGLPDLRLGQLSLVAGSQHLYAVNHAAAETILREDDLSTGGLTYAPLDASEFEHPDDLITHLWSLAHRRTVRYRWLSELQPTSEPSEIAIG